MKTVIIDKVTNEKKKVFEQGDGVRRHFYEALNESRFTYPRLVTRRHSIKWYLDGELTKRPLYGIYAMARLAEHFLNRARFGTKGQKNVIQDAAKFFADTRRTMRNILSTYDIDKRIPRESVDSIRETYVELVEEARYVYTKMRCALRSDEQDDYELMSKNDRRLLEAILIEQSSNGTIPPWSSLFREPTT